LFAAPYLKKAHHKNGLVEWLKVKALSSNPSTSHRHTKKDKEVGRFMLDSGLS
jgi:hypothetical protein